jgi:xylose dehydrogenase (NAD/NADP)
VSLGWGILGAARINRALVPPIQTSSRSRLIGVASRDKARAEEAARLFGAPKAYGSYEELLADPEIAVVYVPLPNHLHAEWTIRAARAGKHVLCEKPLACSVEDVERIADVARSAGVVVAEAFMYRHHPQTLRVRELVASGAIGPAVFVSGSFTFTLDRPGNYRESPAEGGGSLWDVGCYPVSFSRFVLGEEPVEAIGREWLGPSGVDLTFAGLLRFPSGALASFDCGFRGPFRARMEIVGTEGAILVPSPFKPGIVERILLTRGDRQEPIEIAGSDLYAAEVEDMADAVLLGRSPRLSLAESRGNVVALEALLRSAQRASRL